MKKGEPIPVLVDQQEKRAWEFDPAHFSTERVHLPTGDYTVRGLETELVLERKSLGDFVTSVIHDWLRHRKRFYRMAGFEVAAVVVEADLGDVWERRYESAAEPASVVGKAVAIHLDHGVPVYFWGNRVYCVPMVERFLQQAVKKLGGV